MTTVLLLTIGCGCLAQAPLFQYDASVPLNARVVQRMDSQTFTREKVVFDGARGVRVPALVGIPKTGPARHPVVVLIDGIGGWKERWWSTSSLGPVRLLVDSLLAAGIAVAMADAPASGERTFENDFVSAESFIGQIPKWREMGVRNAVETRRLMDYLAARPDVDSTRIGLFGLSHGGMMTFILSAVDSRVKVAVAGVTPMQRIPEELMPTRYAPSIHVPLMMFAGTADGWYTREQAEHALALVPAAEKKILWYDGAHRAPPEAFLQGAAWLTRVLRPLR